MLVGTTITGVSGTVNFNDTQFANSTIGAGTYTNVPTTFENVTFNTADGNINITLDQANTIYIFDQNCEITGTGGNILITATAAGITVSTALDQTRIQQSGGQAFAIDEIVGTLRFTGLQANTRVTIFANVNSTTAEETLFTSAAGNLSTTTPIVVGNSRFYRIHSIGYQSLRGTVEIATAGTNTIAIEQLESDGYSATTGTIFNHDGDEINSNGNISIYFANSVISFDNPTSGNIDIRDGLSILDREWVGANIGGIYNIDKPYQLDSVKGIELINDWTIEFQERTLNEGWIEYYANSNIRSVNYRFITQNNQYNPVYTLIYDGVEETPVTLTGQQNTIIDVDPAPGNVTLDVQIKQQTIEFINQRETIRSSSGASYQRFYKNESINYLETLDRAVSEALPENTAQYRLNQTQITTDADQNGTQHTFDRVLEIQTGVLDRDVMLNQLSAIATFDDFYDEKPYVLEANGSVTIDTGTWVRYRDGTELGGTLAALLTLTSVNDGVFVQPESRNIAFTMDASFDGNIQYIVYNSSTNAVIVDASGNEAVGSLTPNNRSRIVTVFTDIDIPITIAWIDDNVTYGDYSANLTNAGINQTISPSFTDIVAPESSQTSDDPVNGIVAYNSVIDDMIFNTTSKNLIIPTQVSNGTVVKSYNMIYFLFAWRAWVLNDIRRLRFGQAVIGEHQLKPSGATNEAHKYRPGIYFTDGWALDVEATRQTTDIIRLEASAIGRIDEDQNSGLVYRSPLANGANSMAEVIVSGAATQAITNAYNQAVTNALLLNEIKNFNGWLSTGGRLLGMKPLPNTYDPSQNYRDNLEE